MASVPLRIRSVVIQVPRSVFIEFGSVPCAAPPQQRVAVAPEHDPGDGGEGQAESASLVIGKDRRRLPVATKIALTSAGAYGGTPGSPTPQGRMWV